ncbi:hypothetical protein BHE74_00036670 [Ensete ventricosum]|nr:hypothetical protein GW17_00036754 [Ensete ventricosum]RWW56601.1 hypothetical protein BHE74_00036670 [Ensete ventricosum]
MRIKTWIARVTVNIMQRIMGKYTEEEGEKREIHDLPRFPVRSVARRRFFAGGLPSTRAGRQDEKGEGNIASSPRTVRRGVTSPRMGRRENETTPLGTVLAKSHNLASVFAGAEQGTSCSVRRSSPKGMVVSKTSSGKNAKRKVAPTGQISKRDKS